MGSEGYNKASRSSGVFGIPQTRRIRYHFSAPATAEMLTTGNMRAMQEEVAATLPESAPTVTPDGERDSHAFTVRRTDGGHDLMQAMAAVAGAHLAILGFRHGYSISTTGMDLVPDQEDDSSS